MEWWQIKNLFRKYIWSIVLVAVISFAAGLYFSYVPVPTTHTQINILQKSAILTPWSEIKKERLTVCLEEEQEAKTKCETLQDIRSCQNWIYVSDRCNSWR